MTGAITARAGRLDLIRRERGSGDAPRVNSRFWGNPNQPPPHILFPRIGRGPGGRGKTAKKHALPGGGGGGTERPRARPELAWMVGNKKGQENPKLSRGWIFKAVSWGRLLKGSRRGLGRPRPQDSRWEGGTLGEKGGQGVHLRPGTEPCFFWMKVGPQMGHCVVGDGKHKECREGLLPVDPKTISGLFSGGWPTTVQAHPHANQVGQGFQGDSPLGKAFDCGESGGLRAVQGETGEGMGGPSGPGPRPHSFTKLVTVPVVGGAVGFANDGWPGGNFVWVDKQSVGMWVIASWRLQNCYKTVRNSNLS